MTILWFHKQRHRGCLGLDTIEVRLPLCGISYGYGNTAAQTGAVISMTQESLKKGSIELDQGPRRRYAPFLGSRFML